MSDLVIAMFHDRDQAFAAVDALVAAGVAPDCIGFLAARPQRFGQLRAPGVVEHTTQRTSMRAGKGPVDEPNGTLSGPGFTSASSPGGDLQDLTQLDLPSVGPILAAGPLATALQASPSWPGPQAVVDMLVRRGIDTSEARLTLDEIRQGGILLTVHDGKPTRADAILKRYGPIRVGA